MSDELVVGTILRVDEHPGARAPSLLLRVDLGPHGTHEAVLSTGNDDGAALTGRQLVCRREADGVAIVGAHTHGAGLVLVTRAAESSRHARLLARFGQVPVPGTRTRM